jgi:hypothetical protein
MPRKKLAARTRAQNIQVANQRRVDQCEFISVTLREDSKVAAQTVSLADTVESTLLDSNPSEPAECVPDGPDPNLTDFCSRIHFTPAIRPLDDDEGDTDHDLCVSDRSSDIQEEDELKQFTRALQRAQITAQNEEKKKKRGFYSKNSKRTLKRREQARAKLASKGFLPVDQYMTLKGLSVKHHNKPTPTPEPDKAILREESEEGSDEVDGLNQDTCTYSCVSDVSEVESEENSPEILSDAQLHLRLHARMESEESSGTSDGGDAAMAPNRPALITHLTGSSIGSPIGSFASGARRVGNMIFDPGRMCWISTLSPEDEEAVGVVPRGGRSHQLLQAPVSAAILENKEIHTANKSLEDLRRDAALTHEEVSRHKPGSTSQLLSDHSKLREAHKQLTNEAKNGNHDVIVRGRIAAMIGLLNLYTDPDLKYSWTKASEIVAKTQGRGTQHGARRVRESVLDFLRWRDLPLHRMDHVRTTILDDEDIAEEIRGRMVERAEKGFLKAQDVVDIVASPEIQSIFTRKGVAKESISVNTGLRWLEKLGWTYGKLKNGMYLDGHERPDVVEYREAFVKRWMGYELRFHRWDHDGTELPRPNGFPVPEANGRFRLILVTHDESTFFQNDERNTGWSHASSKTKPKAKGNGQSLMVSDFLTPDFGRLRDGDE